jgi:hypothetical protein
MPMTLVGQYDSPYTVTMSIRIDTDQWTGRLCGRRSFLP